MDLQPFSKIAIRCPSYSLLYSEDIPENIEIETFLQGIYLASPNFYYEFIRRFKSIKELKTFTILESNTKLYNALLKFWIRSCSRCTPFGTFAGVGVVSLADRTQLTLKKQHLVKTNIDSLYFDELIKHIKLLPGIKPQIAYYVNSSIYEIGSEFRYVEYSQQGNKRFHSVNKIPKTNYLTDILEMCKKKRTVSEICSILQYKYNIDRNEALKFIDELIDSQILVSELEAPITSGNRFNYLIGILNSYADITEIAEFLNCANSLLNNNITSVIQMADLEHKLRQFIPGNISSKSILHSNLLLQSQDPLLIERNIIKNVIAQINDLVYLSREFVIPELSVFIQEFERKYHSEEIPLCNALDSDYGINYIGKELVSETKFVQELHIETRPNTKKDIDLIQAFALEKYIEYLRSNNTQIEIESSELSRFRSQNLNPNIPTNFYALGNFLNKNNEFNSTNFEFNLIGFGGPSGGNLLSRFANHSEEIRDLLKEITNSEQQTNEDCIYAEIIHLPDSTAGNILERPALREYEIPYLSSSSLPENFQIPISDILVSVRGGQVLLRSKRLKKRIIPRLTSAHNYKINSLPIYRFLCDIQTQGLSSFGIWDWGILQSQLYLPRVIYKNLILQRARWLFDESEALNVPEKNEHLIMHFDNIRLKRNIPTKICIAQGDNELLIDFSNEKHISIFLSQLKKYKQLTLKEYLIRPERAIIKNDSTEPLANEVIIPMQQVIAKSYNEFQFNDLTSSSKRKHGIIDDWVYFKIYCSPNTSEDIITSLILPFIEKEYQRALFSKVFFIRYKDSDYHIRLRFYCLSSANQLNLIDKFSNVLKPYLESSQVFKVQLDNYVREIERYGSDTMESVESVFHNDSICIMNIIRQISTSITEEKRIMIAIKNVDLLLTDFNIQLKEKQQITQKQLAYFFDELGASPILRKQLNAKYRAMSPAIQRYLEDSDNVETGLLEIKMHFTRRSLLNKKPILYITSSTKRDEVDIIASIIHMSINRLFPTSQRKYELIVYHFLEKYYASSERKHNTRN